MTLRLSSPSTPITVDGCMKQISDDASLSLKQKNDCLKTLAVVLKNTIDPQKGGLAGDAGSKYRTLKLDNPKLQSRLFCAPSVKFLLCSDLVGMVATNNNNTLTMPEALALSQTACDRIGLVLLPAVSTTQQTLQLRVVNSNNNSNSSNSNSSSHKKAKLTEHNHNQNRTTTANSSSVPEKLTEKQKARLLLAETERLEKEREKAFRKETRAKIKADKLVRQTDENWKPTVSAAADKTGKGLLSFRDRHGNE